jgi:hypothetical protein
MIAKILEKRTGKDDLERVACKEGLALLNAYLKKRPVFIPQRPKRFLDFGSFTRKQLLEQVRLDAEQLGRDEFEPWIMEIDGMRRLPVFSNKERMKTFATMVTKDLQHVFGLGSIEILLENITKDLDIDFVDLNPLNEKSWEIGIGKKR